MISAEIQRCDGEEQVCVHVLLVCGCVCVRAREWVYVHLSTNVFQKKKMNETIISPLSVEVWFQSSAKYCGSADQTQD